MSKCFWWLFHDFPIFPRILLWFRPGFRFWGKWFFLKKSLWVSLSICAVFSGGHSVSLHETLRRLRGAPRRAAAAALWPGGRLGGPGADHQAQGPRGQSGLSFFFSECWTKTKKKTKTKTKETKKKSGPWSQRMSVDDSTHELYWVIWHVHFYRPLYAGPAAWAKKLQSSAGKNRNGHEQHQI